jgi:hypothetical protein
MQKAAAVVRVTIPGDRQSIEHITAAVAPDVGLEVTLVRSVVQAVKDLAEEQRRFVLLAELQDSGPATEATLSASIGSFDEDDSSVPAHLVRRFARVPEKVAESLGGPRLAWWAAAGKRVFADLPSTTTMTLPGPRDAAERTIIDSFRSLPEELVDEVHPPFSELRLVRRTGAEAVEYGARVRLTDEGLGERTTLEVTLQALPGYDATAADEQLQTFARRVLDQASQAGL